MISGTQPKILMTQDEDGTLKMDKTMEELLYAETVMRWELVRERDGLTKRSGEIRWIEWDEHGAFKDKHEFIGVGYSLLMSPFNQYFTWQTTEVTEITEKGDFHVKFKTKNSNYSLYKI